MPEQILPGTYITVRDDALISAGQVVTGNIGIVGTASMGPVNQVQILGSFSDARNTFGDADPWQGGSANELTLLRALEQIYNNGGSAVYAVRTANKATANAAAYQTRKSATLLTKLIANTPGTWGNNITVSISDGTKNSFVTETLAGDAGSLRRKAVFPKSPLNTISVKQKSTGLTVSYNIVYDTAPDNTKPQVEINSTTGALTFTTLAGFAPVAADTIVASYEVPQSSSKTVGLSYGATAESYTVADTAHLADLVNQKSALVTATTDPSFYNQLPDNTAVSQFFGTGLDGNSAGSNGETASADDYKNSLALLENEIVNIVHLCGQDATNSAMLTNLEAHINTTAGNRRERIAVIGSNGNDDLKTIAGHGIDSPRIIFVAPGIQVSGQTRLPGAYTAAAVAGLIASLPVQTSPTNKSLTIPGVSKAFSASQLENLVTSRVLAIENRNGFRIVKGITTATNSAWTQITTRRIVDYAIYGVRSACDPYIGKLNNDRVRSAMKATIDAFLTRMTDDEALVSYKLDVTATRAQQIAGQCIVTMTIQPTFSIDFVVVTMYLG